ncbi:branched-chain amino acid ABC transporter ATP-binding protein/permease [Achromobacter insolitus]|uniref:branched-chain amino acid ABC transporter ATP-binding protein/permease n=1 Tax=Achromobacter insolitus TaxID=217204 RepID=UPI0007C37406|nr:branched-chain amino acid ABC transporter ATP-binding protein/permease [Achromobacter insolitus]OAD14849.1 ABC transporter [Achromobacter insolitus]
MENKLASRHAALALYALLAAAALAMAATVNGYYVFVLGNMALLALAGIGLNVLLGLTGQMSFGHAGFYAIGAYTVAILTGQAGWSFWLAWPAAALVAGAFGLLLALPALRVKGPYLAMITIAFGFIVEHALIEGGEVTGGQNGLMGIAQPSLGGIGGDRGVAMLAIVTVFAALAAYALLSRGTWGAAMRAVKDSETASESIGINPLTVKTVAFMVSAALVGLAGGLYAPQAGMITPHNFNFMQSILFVLAVTLGGAGSLAGPLLGAVVVGLLPELLSGLEEYRLLFFGAFLLVVLWAAPEGMVGLLSRWRRHARAHALTPRTGGVIFSGNRLRRPLRAEMLTMTFGGVRAVQAVSFVVRPGAVTALIGPNGAGKSTVINMLSGYYQPTSGAVALGDAPLAGLPAYGVARHGIGRTYQTSQLFDTLTVEDNVALGMARGRLGGLLASRRYLAPDVRERARSLLAFCGYEGALDAPAADLPHVDRRLVEIARALATDADILLMDEPAAGLSREDKTRLATLLRRIAQAGTGVLLVEHDMALVMGVSDHIVAIDAGRELAQGCPTDIQQSPAVRQAYLGDEAARKERETRHRPEGAPMAPEVLGVGNLVTGYGANPVLHGIDLQVRQGEMVALLGANGAGKSTLMRTLAGLHRPVQGGMHLQGLELNGLSADRIVARGLVLVPEGRQVFPGLSVLDNIRLGAFLHPQDREARVEEMLTRFPRLRERLHQRAGLLSGGEQQMLAIARGLMSKPVILLLDEPSLGLAPRIIDELFDSLDRLRSESMTILLVDQMAPLALALADRAYVLDSGRVAAHGTAQDIARDGTLARAYLGG